MSYPYHPEAKPNEVFVGNVKTSKGVPEDIRHLPSARLGSVAYDIDGRKLDPSYMLPLLIGKADEQAYDDIRMKALRAIRGWQTT